MGSTVLTNETTVGAANDYTVTGTGCAGVAGADRVYSVQVPAGFRLTASVASQTTGFDPSISLGTLAACTNTGRVCVASDDSGSATTVNTARYANPGSSTLELFIFIDSFSAATPGAFTLTVSVDPVPPGETCGTAIPLMSGAPLTMQTLTGAANDVSGAGTSCATTNAGPDLVYVATVQPGQAVTVTATPTASLDLSLSLVREPATNCGLPRTCTTSSSLGGAGVAEVATWTNPASTPQQLFIIVDSPTTVPSGTFTIGVTASTPQPGDICATALPLPLDGGTSATTFGMLNDYQGGTGCTTTTGPELVFTGLIPAGQRLVASATPTVGVDLALSAVLGPASACEAPRACVAQSNVGGVIVGEQLLIPNTSSTAQPVFLLVDAVAGNGGLFLLDTRIEPIPPGEACSGPEPFVASGTFTTSGFSNDHNGGSGCGNVSTSGSGPDRVFSITVPAGQRMTASVTPSGWDASLSLLSPAQCGPQPQVCRTGSDVGGSGTTETVVATNTGMTPETVLLVVDGYASTGAGSFSLVVGFTPAPTTVQPGDTCATAATLAPVTTLSIEGATAGLANDYTSSAAGCSTLASADGVYRVPVPAGKVLTATVTGIGGFDPNINLVTALAACAPALTCAASDDSGSATTANTVQLANPTTGPLDAWLVIDSRGTATGTFGLTVALADLPPALAPGDVCATAPALMIGQTISGSTASLMGDYGTGTSCLGSAGPDGVYSVTVPAGQQLSASLTPFTPFNASLSIVAGPAATCGGMPRACLASSDSAAPGAPETATWLNASAAAEVVFLVVDSSSATATGAFTLSTALTAALPGEVCSNAVPILMSGAITGETTVGYANQLAPASSCTGFGTAGADKVYAVSVNDGQTLTASVTRTGSSGDPAIYLVAGPASSCTATPTCLDGDDSGGATTVNSVTWTNTTGATQTVFIVIDSISSNVSQYTLTTSVM